MILYPAIDLKDGQCVRLVKGDMTRATVFNADPAAQARSFEAAGFSHLHLVDLNGAVEGSPVNGAAVSAILEAVRMTTQLGGGIRDEATAAHWLESGVDRVIVGTLALQQPEITRALCKRYPGRIAIAIDARQGRVAAEGWLQQSDVWAVDLARAYEDAGAAAIIYTDIERDGAMGGINAAQTAALAAALTTPVIASGGIAGLADLEALKKVAAAGIVGAICGRALYDGALDPAAALALLAA